MAKVQVEPKDMIKLRKEDICNTYQRYLYL